MKSTPQHGAVVLAAGLLFASSGHVSAASTLADLLVPGASITSGNLVFDNFANVNGVGDLSVANTDIYVLQIQSGADYGIRFQSAYWTLTGSNLAYELSFDFRVHTLDNSALIEDNTLTIVGSNSGPGHSLIAEYVLALDSTALASERVYINQIGTGSNVFTASDTFTGYPPVAQSEVAVHKVFVMTTTDSDLTASMFVSHFDQTFSQVPELGSATLLGLGLAGLLGRRRRA